MLNSHPYITKIVVASVKTGIKRQLRHFQSQTTLDPMSKKVTLR